jgi:hypothetical protein
MIRNASLTSLAALSAMLLICDSLSVGLRMPLGQ